MIMNGISPLLTKLSAIRTISSSDLNQEEIIKLEAVEISDCSEKIGVKRPSQEESVEAPDQKKTNIDQLLVSGITSEMPAEEEYENVFEAPATTPAVSCVPLEAILSPTGKYVLLLLNVFSDSFLFFTIGHYSQLNQQMALFKF